MPSPEEPLTGGCACGTIRFQVTAPFKTAGYCHCKRCQQRSGALWSLNGVVDGASLEIVQGAEALRTWRPRAASRSPTAASAAATCSAASRATRARRAPGRGRRRSWDPAAWRQWVDSAPLGADPRRRPPRFPGQRETD